MLGAGTATNPYIIEDITDLQNVNLDLSAYYELGNDIDASATTGWNGGRGFLPIGGALTNFLGRLDGKNYTVTGLYQNITAVLGSGVFGFIGATAKVKNIKFVNSNITHSNCANGFTESSFGEITNVSVSGTITGLYPNGFGFTHDGVVENCSVNVTMTVVGAGIASGFFYVNNGTIASSSVAGSASGLMVIGFVYQNTGIISKCFTTCAVSGSSSGAGFCLYQQGTITDCYATGAVTGSDISVGFCYNNDTTGTISRCYSVGAVNPAATQKGGFCCGNSHTITGCYWDTQTSGCATSDGGTGKTTAQMKAQATFTSWDFVATWGINEGVSYPTLIPWSQVPGSAIPLPFTTSISFTTDSFETPVWESIAADIMHVSIHRGRQNEMNRVETSTATLILKNIDGNYWPDLTTGSHYPYVKPLKQIQIVENYAGIIYGLFNGLIESWTPGFLQQQGMKIPIVTVTCVCVMKSLARHLLNSLTPYPQELSGERINRVLDAFGWPTANRIIDPGISEVQTQAAVVNINALEHIQSIADAEYGQFFFDGAGNAVFHDRNHRVYAFLSSTLATTDAEFGEAMWGDAAFGEDSSTYVLFATFGNPPAAGEQKYSNVDYLIEDQYVYNLIHITIAGGIEQTETDIASGQKYGQRDLSKSGLLLTSDAEAAAEASYLLSLYKEMYSRVRQMTVLPAADSANLYPLVYGYDISQRININLVEAGISKGFYIEGISHEWDAKAPQMWATIWQLSNAEVQIWWILGDAVYGILGSTTRIGF